VQFGEGGGEEEKGDRRGRGGGMRGKGERIVKKNGRVRLVRACIKVGRAVEGTIQAG